MKNIRAKELNQLAVAMNPAGPGPTHSANYATVFVRKYVKTEFYDKLTRDPLQSDVTIQVPSASSSPLLRCRMP